MEEAITNRSGIPNRAKSARLLAKFLTISMSLSETMEVANHWSSETDFIEYRALTATIKVILYVIGSIPILQSMNFAISSIGRAKD